MAEKLSWEEIKQQYDQEWVELVDYDWPDTETYPRSGIVRVHANTRAKFDDLADIDPPFDSAYIFVGQTKKDEDVVVTRGYSRVIIGPDHA
jgi:glutamine synthetase